MGRRNAACASVVGVNGGGAEDNAQRDGSAGAGGGVGGALDGGVDQVGGAERAQLFGGELLAQAEEREKVGDGQGWHFPSSVPAFNPIAVLVASERAA